MDTGHHRSAGGPPADQPDGGPGHPPVDRPDGRASADEPAHDSPGARPDQVASAVARAHREEWAYVLAAAARVARDLDLAEDCVQDAYARALTHWSVDGVPRNPAAWLTTVATRRALEQRRRAANLARKIPLLVTDASEAAEVDALGPGGNIGPGGNKGDSGGAIADFPDDRLRLIFTCCHPALSPEAQLALTLRLVCGLTSAEVARAFLVKEPTMQARITRAKKKIAEARIPYRVPRQPELPERVGVVLDAVHLLYSSGYTATSGDELVRGDLAARALDLATMMHVLLPDAAEVKGLLALLRLTEARRPARVSHSGELILMEHQDRGLWDRAGIDEGLRLVRQALARPPAGRYALMAAIAAVHGQAPRWEDTDWPQLLGLYDLLLRRWPTPVVTLNRAVAVSFVHGPEAALHATDQLAGEPVLATYPYLAATRADLFRRLGRTEEAVAAYQEALLLSDNAAEAAFLTRRLDALHGKRHQR
ncbi:MAG: RNA polymerase sigma factor [Micromonosporaceae bacterium]